MLTTGRVQITDHAATRYVKRVDGTLTVEEAKRLLEQLAPKAAPLREKTILGQEQWRLEHPFPCVLVVKRDRGMGSEPVVVTVWDAPVADEEQAQVDRIVALQAHQRSRSRIRMRYGR